MPMNEDDDDARHRANIAALIAVAIIILLGVVAFHFISKNLAMERCQEERRSDCNLLTDNP
jgi:hypothetical protein